LYFWPKARHCNGRNVCYAKVTDPDTCFDLKKIDPDSIPFETPVGIIQNTWDGDSKN